MKKLIKLFHMMMWLIAELKDAYKHRHLLRCNVCRSHYFYDASNPSQQYKCWQCVYIKRKREAKRRIDFPKFPEEENGGDRD